MSRVGSAVVELDFNFVLFPFAFRSPVTHRMAPWVSRVFIQILPRILCIERPKKENPPEDEQPEVLTDVFHVPHDVNKFNEYGSKRYSGDYGLPGEFLF